MPPSASKCPDSILRLVERFNQHADTIRAPGYNETQIRIDFINPMFAALGWDMDNTQAFAEQYREVVHEDKVKVAGQTKAPDYSFRVGGQRKFFLEAKKPAVDIKNNWEPAYQLRRYAWSAKLPCSLLTDFEELAIYDTRLRPVALAKASVARREFIPYTDYESRWDFIDGTFSKAAVLRGDFDKYCDTKKGRGVELFDDAFLAEIEDWRKSLASNLALRNESLDGPGLNFAVQRIIDRILFLRIAEDRGTETIGQLQSLLNGDHVYDRLKKLFRDADARYNSGIFHFQKEKDRDEAPDTLTPDLEIDDKALKQIIEALYYPKSPYEFTMVSADILGSVYERFLGKVITLTAGHRAKIEEKPEVRKAGGVYYTPTYIVDYIVKNTVGKLLEGKSPKDAAKIKVLDPACGSGSFLIGAYQFLLDWYLAQYLLSPLPEGGGLGVGEVRAQNIGTPAASLTTGKSAVLRPTHIGGYALTIAERKRILLDHIHGVDLDSQAVEVTKLNLLLKCLEGETSQTLGFEAKLFKERALPDLGNNILCGNSLIGTDIVGTDAWKEMDDEERVRVNPFDYAQAFPLVFKEKGGGFDAVVGNPPYIFGEYISSAQCVYLSRHFRLATKQFDLYWLFIEKTGHLLRKQGRASLIVPDAMLARDMCADLREMVLQQGLDRLFHCGVVFDAAVSAVVFVVSAKHAADSVIVDASVSKELRRIPRRRLETTSRDVWTIHCTDEQYSIVEKMRKSGTALGEILKLSRGEELGKKHFGAEGRFEICVGENIGRYQVSGPFRRVNKILKDPALYKSPKIVVVKTGVSCVAALDLDDRVTMQSVYNAKPIVPDINLKVVLAVLNSRATAFWVRKTFTEYKLLFPQLNQSTVEGIPLPGSGIKRQVELENLVSGIVSLLSRITAEKLPQRREQLQREIDATDRQIDALVYQLYGLTEAEIKIVEDATAKT